MYVGSFQKLKIFQADVDEQAYEYQCSNCIQYLILQKNSGNRWNMESVFRSEYCFHRTTGIILETARFRAGLFDLGRVIQKSLYRTKNGISSL
jgi:hypothetical protein